MPISIYWLLTHVSQVLFLSARLSTGHFCIDEKPSQFYKVKSNAL